MKKTILITCIALVLLSFVSCNLDNNGILRTCQKSRSIR